MVYQKNRINLILYNTGSWSAGSFTPTEPVQHDVIQHWILSAGDVIPEEPDQHDAIKLDPDKQMLYLKNLISMLLYNIGSWSAGAFIPIEQDQHDAISAGDVTTFYQHDVIKHWILISRRFYTRRAVWLGGRVVTNVGRTCGPTPLHTCTCEGCNKICLYLTLWAWC